MTVRLDEMSLANLANARLPRSKNNVITLIAWACGENNSTDISTKAKWNCWDTEEKMSGSTDFNTAGVQNYPSMIVGLQAWAKTLNNGHYQSIISCLERSDEPQVTLDAIADTPWGYAVDRTILPTILGNLAHYAGLPVGGSEDGTTVTVVNGDNTSAQAAEQVDGLVATDANTTVAPKTEPLADVAPEAPAEVTKDKVVSEGDSILSALSTQLSSYITDHKSANSQLAGQIRSHISELEAIATALENLV